MVSERPYKVPMPSASQMAARGWGVQQQTGFEAEF
jgi:hypothetical protein